mmetsp:Transcript_19149/g.48147  ORF Transcript_19149/g.48147 Transcript_19149/m.48147 type:complete len:220 (-) Transcript_19149:2603-3262(-)
MPSCVMPKFLTQGAKELPDDGFVAENGCSRLTQCTACAGVELALGNKLLDALLQLHLGLKHVDGEALPVEGVRLVAQQVPDNSGTVQDVARGRQQHRVFHELIGKSVLKLFGDLPKSVVELHSLRLALLAGRRELDKPANEVNVLEGMRAEEVGDLDERLVVVEPSILDNRHGELFLGYSEIHGDLGKDGEQVLGLETNLLRVGDLQFHSFLSRDLSND